MGTNVTPVLCDQCGGSLEVIASQTHIECRWRGVALTVKRKSKDTRCTEIANLRSRLKRLEMRAEYPNQKHKRRQGDERMTARLFSVVSFVFFVFLFRMWQDRPKVPEIDPSEVVDAIYRDRPIYGIDSEAPKPQSTKSAADKRQPGALSLD